MFSLVNNSLQDLLSSLNAVISTNESTQYTFITGHMIYNPAYTYKFQLKTTHMEKQTKNLPIDSISHLHNSEAIENLRQK